MVTLHQKKSLIKNIVVTPVARPSLVQEILKPMYELILVRNHSNATAVMRSFQTNRSLIVTWKRTTSELPNVRLLVIRVEKPFTTAPLSTLMSAHQQQQTNNRKRNATTSNDAPAAKKSKRTTQASVSTASEPPATPQASATATGSSWQTDPVLIPSNLIPAAEENITDTYRQRWPQIRTRFSRRNRFQDWYNFRLSTISPTALREQFEPHLCRSAYRL